MQAHDVYELTPADLHATISQAALLVHIAA